MIGNLFYLNPADEARMDKAASGMLSALGGAVIGAVVGPVVLGLTTYKITDSAIVGLLGAVIGFPGGIMLGLTLFS